MYSGFRIKTVNQREREPMILFFLLSQSLFSRFAPIWPQFPEERDVVEERDVREDRDVVEERDAFQPLSTS